MDDAPRNASDKEERDALLATLVAGAMEGILAIDSGGCVKIFNPACEILFGYSPSEVIGRNVKLLVPSPVRDGHEEHFTGHRGSLDHGFVGHGPVLAGRRKDGTSFPLALSLGEAQIGGEPLIVGVVRDITEQRGRVAELSSQEARLRAVIDTAVDGVILIDEAGRVLDVNPACVRLFGFSAPEVIGQNVRMLMPEPYRSAHDGYIQRYMETKEPRIIGIGREVSGRRKDGSVFPMELSVGEANQGDRRIFVGIVRDVTARKQVEEALRQKSEALARSNEELERFAAVASHDLNEPLRKIIAFSGLLTDGHRGELSDEAREYVAFIAQAGKRMRRLIRDLLSYARIPNRTPPCDAVDLTRVLDEVLSDLSLQISDADAIIDSMELPTIEAEPIEMRQLLQNLVSNALKYRSPDRPPHIRISSSSAEIPVGGEPVEVAEIVVTDNGIGFPPSRSEEILQPFRRLHAVDEYEGTGIGLAICQKIVRRHGGEISATGEEGVGATFTVRLPLRQPRR